MADGVAPLSILLASSEVVGFAKTGGLADVCGYLPRALARRGHRCAVILPLYRSVRNGPIPIQPTDHYLSVPIRHQMLPARLWRSKLPDSDVDVYLVEHGELFERDDPAKGYGLYQMTLPDGRRQDYPDNCGRFVFFCRAVMEAIPYVGFAPDVLHANDWQTGLLPVYVRELYQHRPGYQQVHTLLTIHNIAYQGVFKSWEYALTGLNWRLFNHHQLEFYGQLNFLKAGIVFADWISTVSPTYAREICTSYFGNGLEGVLNERRNRLSGIVNGVDYTTWNPATDRRIAANYDVDSVREGKALCKADLQRRFDLPQEPRTPVLGMIARLVEQKGIDLVLKAANDLMKLGVQLIVLGEGDPEYHARLTALRQRYPQQVGLKLGFDEVLAHPIESGADLYLMPSLFEPSGLNQLYSLKYGTPPIVRATGGLADTITDATDENLANGTATGFTFLAYTPAALLGAVQRALDLYRDRSDEFLKVIRTGMQEDWSWDHAAGEYEQLYVHLKEEVGERRSAIRPAESH
jgi:starch synthase